MNENCRAVHGSIGRRVVIRPEDFGQEAPMEVGRRGSATTEALNCPTDIAARPRMMKEVAQSGGLPVG